MEQKQRNHTSKIKCDTKSSVRSVSISIESTTVFSKILINTFLYADLQLRLSNILHQLSIVSHIQSIDKSEIGTTEKTKYWDKNRNNIIWAAPRNFCVLTVPSVLLQRCLWASSKHFYLVPYRQDCRNGIKLQ